MYTSSRKIINEMFAAFDTKDLDRVVNTFSKDAVCIYHGTQLMPAAKFIGIEGVKMFFEFNFLNFNSEKFEKVRFIEENNIIVVLGNERFISKVDSKEYHQNWVQVYTVRDGLISRMEEFATSALPDQYGGNAVASQKI